SELENAATRAGFLTNRLLAFVAPATHGEAAALDVRNEIEELQPVLQRLVGASLLKVEVGPGELVVHVPRGAFQQVLLNLVINARDAMEGESGMLRVDVCFRGKDEERMIVLEVADRGCGIEESALQRIFEPFYTTKSTGTGLGLSTVRDIVEQY